MRGEEVRLTQREFDLLLFLAQHPGQVFTRDELMRTNWQYSVYTDTSTRDDSHAPASHQD